MKTDFHTLPQTFAFPLSELARIAELVQLYGAELPDVPTHKGSPTTLCLAGGIDREGSDDLRSLSYPSTASTTALSDGRHAFRGCWSLALLAAIGNAEVVAEELTDEEFSNLVSPVTL